MIPDDKLRSLPGAERYIKAGITFEQLDATAHAISDNQAAERLNKIRHQLFQTNSETLTIVA